MTLYVVPSALHDASPASSRTAVSVTACSALAMKASVSLEYPLIYCVFPDASFIISSLLYVFTGFGTPSSPVCLYTVNFSYVSSVTLLLTVTSLSGMVKAYIPVTPFPLPSFERLYSVMSLYAIPLTVMPSREVVAASRSFFIVTMTVAPVFILPSLSLYPDSASADQIASMPSASFTVCDAGLPVTIFSM